jgi:hypothetical protein
MSIILGLDVSTSNIGIVLLGRDCLLHASNISMIKLEDQYDKANLFREKLRELSEKFAINHIHIEEPLQRFTRGMSSANTISTLARFNGIVSYITYDITGIKPELSNVTVARKVVGIKIPKKDPNSKEIVLGWVKSNQEFSDYVWPSKELKSGPRKGQIVAEPGCYDIADAAVMAYYGRHLIFSEQ